MKKSLITIATICLTAVAAVAQNVTIKAQAKNADAVFADLMKQKRQKFRLFI